MKEINKEKRMASPCEPSRPRSGVILGRQSNHDDFYLPECLRHLGDPPLYMAVAWWGLLSGQGITRDDISLAFRIPPRRAADVMSYISRDRGDIITCERRVVRTTGRRSLVLTITDVRDVEPAAPLPPPRAKKTAGQGGADPVREWRRWFLSRPNTAPTR